MIDVLIPVLSRPQNAKKVVASFRANSSQMDEIHFICSPGDDAQIEACLQTGENVLIADWKSAKADYARKMNLAFSATDRPWVFLGSDDIEFRSGWSETALALEADVIATNDLTNSSVQRGEFGTHCLVRRSYVEEYGASADGGFLHEGYDHNFVDRELCGVAQYRKVYAFAKNSHVKHHWRKSGDDPTYRKGLRHFQQDRRLFLSRAHLWGFCGLTQLERQVSRRERRSRSRS